MIAKAYDPFELYEAVTALYEAGYWTCDRNVDEDKLWERVRNALKRTPGCSPAPVESTQPKEIGKPIK